MPLSELYGIQNISSELFKMLYNGNNKNKTKQKIKKLLFIE